jgi:hypothetical protein
MARRLVWLAAACLSVPLTGACTSILGDFNTGPGGGDGGDASTDGRSTDAKTDAPKSDANSGGTVTAEATGGTVYVAQTASVDGSKSTVTEGTATFSWSVSSAPSGSAITTSSLAGKNSAMATFVPDVAGEYKLTLTVGNGKKMSTATATVVAVAAKAFYFEATAVTDGGLSQSSGGNGAFTYNVVDHDGKNGHAVTCPDVQPLSLGVGYVGLWGGLAFDFWEGEAGVPPRFVGFVVDVNADSGTGYDTHLFSGTSQSSCDASPPTDFGYFVPPSGSGTDQYAVNPRFRADGQRFVILDQHYNVVTFSFDGKGTPTVVANYAEASDAALSGTFDPGTLETSIPRPQWFGSSVAWARPTTNGWQILTAPDSSSAPVTVYMNCLGVTPREFAFLPSGNVLVSFRQSTTGPENLYQLDKSCAVVHSYTQLSDSGASVATDFSVSPDGTTLAFLSVDPAAQDAAPFSTTEVGGYLFIGPVDGSAKPHQVGTEPLLYGPRWVAGGALLVTTRSDGLPDAGGGGLPKTSVLVVNPNADSGAGTVVAASDGINTTLSTSGNGACSMSPRGVGPGALALLSLTALAHFARRRKRGAKG